MAATELHNANATGIRYSRMAGGDLCRKIRSLSDWLEVFERELDENLANGIISLKSVIAYQRSIRFEEVSFKDAAIVFQKALKERTEKCVYGDKSLVLPKVVRDL
ncbi:hypothetical protein [Mesotoga sp. UBA5557]|uniref:hypothetical protein n=1 Tax=Mesotoga sp. UBA5557 TaxID=1946857 RepID=UPI0025D1467C|nr:hypothetical protein [Mesotoga sp. UBA5557]